MSIESVKAIIDDAYNRACKYHEEIWDSARAVDREPKIYLHWSAGGYNTTFSDYHINIKGDGEIVYTSDNLAQYRPATYHRNSGSISISLCCCAGATSEDLGSNPPTREQVEAMCQVAAGLCEGLWLTCDKYHVMTHGEAADNEDGIFASEPYGPSTTCERWDLEVLGLDESVRFHPWVTDGTRGGDVLRGKINWYIKKYLKGQL